MGCPVCRGTERVSLYATGDRACLECPRRHRAMMRQLCSLMYWMALDGDAEAELRMGHWFSENAPDRIAEAGEGWALKARADALGGAMLEAAYPTGVSLPPGLEWTR